MAFKKTPSKIRYYFLWLLDTSTFDQHMLFFSEFSLSWYSTLKSASSRWLRLPAPLQNSLEHLGYYEGMISDTLCAQYQQKMEWFEGPTLVDLAYGRKQAIWLDDAFPPLKQILFCFIRCVSFLKLSKYDLKLLQNMNLSLKIPVIWSWMKLNLL